MGMENGDSKRNYGVGMFLFLVCCVSCSICGHAAYFADENCVDYRRHTLSLAAHSWFTFGHRS
jgi:uncharacterized membrane protein YadS